MDLDRLLEAPLSNASHAYIQHETPHYLADALGKVTLGLGLAVLAATFPHHDCDCGYECEFPQLGGLTEYSGSLI